VRSEIASGRVCRAVRRPRPRRTTFGLDRASKQEKGKAMQSRRSFVVALSALSLVGLARPLAADRAAEDEAADAARAWLAIVDEGRYAQSWDEAAPAFKEAVTKDQWLQALGSVRAPLGSCLSRKPLARQLVESLPGAPKGPYVVMQFTTDFQGKAGAIETVTPALGADGRWRVSGYFIK
jgi:hypothetical protein